LLRKQSEENSFVNEEYLGVDSPMQIQDLEQKQVHLPISQDATVNYLGSSYTPQTTEMKNQVSPVQYLNSKNFFDSDAVFKDNRRFTEMPV